MGLLGLYMGKVSQVRKKMAVSTVFLKLVRPFVFGDPAWAENRVDNIPQIEYFIEHIYRNDCELGNACKSVPSDLEIGSFG